MNGKFNCVKSVKEWLKNIDKGGGELSFKWFLLRFRPDLSGPKRVRILCFLKERKVI
jgi:hypothetical protein